MDDMRHLHYVLTLRNKTRKPVRRLETHSKTQAEVLSAFSHRVDVGGVYTLCRRKDPPNGNIRPFCRLSLKLLLEFEPVMYIIPNLSDF